MTAYLRLERQADAIIALRIDALARRIVFESIQSNLDFAFSMSDIGGTACNVDKQFLTVKEGADRFWGKR